jgi:DNA-binding NtrC family response regulator
MRGKVLYVEDEARRLWVQAIRDRLRRYGYEIDLVDGPTGALAALRRSPRGYNAILLDVLMPTENLYTSEESAAGSNTGLLLLKDIRELDTQIPIVIVSVKTHKWFIDVLKEGLVQAALEKPANAAKVARVLDRVLGVMRTDGITETRQ